MSDPLEETKLKLKWAENQIANVRREVEAFRRSKPYRLILEIDSETREQVQKAYLSTPIPETILEATGYAVSNLRGTLDYVMVALAKLNGYDKVNDVHFPFAGTLEHFEGKQTKAKIKKLPPRAQRMALGLKAYPAGNDFLYALNTLRGADQHRMIVPIGAPTPSGVTITGGFFSGGITIGDINWQRLEDGIELFRIAEGGSINLQPQIELSLRITFGDVEGVKGWEVVMALHQLRNLVEDIVSRFEARFFN